MPSDFWAAGQICVKSPTQAVCTGFIMYACAMFSAAHQSQSEIVRMSRSFMFTCKEITCSQKDTFVTIPLKMEVESSQ